MLSNAAFHGSTVTRHGRTAPGHRVGARRSLVAVVLALALASCHSGRPRSARPGGAAERTILIDSLAIMLAIVVPTILATSASPGGSAPRTPGRRYRPDWEFSGRIELVVWAIPAAGDHPARRRGLDRIARPRPGQAARSERQRRSRSRSSRSTGSGCSSTPTRGSRASTSSSCRRACRCTSRSPRRAS